MHIPQDLWCGKMALDKKTLPFGESHWDYLPDLLQNYIEYLAARAAHQDRMRAVCKSIHLYGAWCYQNQTPMEMLLECYPETSLVITSQVCPECFKIFSPEIDLSKHLSACRGDEFFEKKEMAYFSIMFENAVGDDFIDDVYDEDEYYW